MQPIKSLVSQKNRVPKIIYRLGTISALVFLLHLAAALLPPRVCGESAPRAIVVAWDGTVPDFVHELLREDHLPHLKSLINSGAFADDVISVFPPKTAPAFAALWTGAPPRTTGISGNRVPREPRGRHTILESESGFRGAPLRAEPIWSAAHRSGKKVVMTHIPLSGEMSEHSVKFRGFDAIVGRDGVLDGRNTKPKPLTTWLNPPASVKTPLEISFTVGASRFFGLLIDDPTDPKEEYDTLIVTATRDGQDIKARLKPGAAAGGKRAWSSPIDIRSHSHRNATVYFRLFDLKPDGADFLLYFTRPVALTPAEREWLIGAGAPAGAFVGNGANDSYLQGAFGRTIPNGGEGIAETRYLETILFSQQRLIEINRWALARFSWDLFLAYTPFPDEAEHLWRGYLDPALPGHRPQVAARLRPFLAEVYRSCDEFLGLFAAKRPDNTILAVISDHGIEGIDKVVAINKALQRAGLLVSDSRGRVVLGKTKVIYPNVNNGYFLLNTTDRKGGIVAREQRAELVKQLRDTLLDLRDGDRRLIQQTYDAESDGPAMGIGGASGGDIYVVPLPGYDFDAKLDGKPAADLVRSRPPIGTHGFSPRRASMRTLMVLAGPGVVRGRRLPEPRIIDVAPTLAKLLGIATPKDSTGRVLEEALTKAR
ncbi:MAG TPA: alkaline phosphatase family protein [Candidatus Binatia bacterium]|nr:alkaline phosphatase family protein [Candidatus Binatia bacterium]